MKNKRKMIYLLLAALCSMPMQMKSSQSPSITSGVYITGAALIGAATLADWYFTETDEQLLARGKARYASVCSNYRDLSYYLEDAYHVDVLTPSQARRILDELKEEVVYSLGLTVWNMNEQEHTYRAALRSAASEMSYLKVTLAKRIYNLEALAIDYNQQRKVGAMRKLVKKIEETLPHLMLLSDYFERHSRYYELFWSEALMLKRYNVELNAVSYYAGDQFLLLQHIKQQVLHNGGSYAYIVYVAQLDRDISILHNQVDNLGHRYVERIGYAQQLLKSLHYIKSTVMSDPRYGQELYTREQEQLNNKRVIILQDQLQQGEWDPARVYYLHNGYWD